MASVLSDPRPHHFFQAMQEVPVNSDSSPITLQQALDYYAGIRDANFPYRCPKCGGGDNGGHYDREVDSGVEDDEVQVTCDVCDGWGATYTQQRARIAGYEPVPISS